MQQPDQLEMFPPPRVSESPRPVPSQASEPEHATLAQVYADFAARRASRPGSGRSGCCRFCGCTPGDPCRTADGESCILNVQTGVCSGDACRSRLAKEVRRARCA